MKQYFIILFIFISILNAEELTQSETMQAAFILGLKKGIIGIAEETTKIISNPNKIVNNVKKLEENQRVAREKGNEHRIKRLSKSVNHLYKERSKYLHLFSEEQIKNRNLKREIEKLKKTIEEYNMYHENEKSKEAIKKEKAIKKMRMNWKSNK